MIIPNRKMTDEEFGQYLLALRACNEMCWYRHIVAKELVYRMSLATAWEMCP